MSPSTPHHAPADECPARRAAPVHARERGVRAVVALTAVMMVVEIAVGYVTRSMALLADGWHMATHVAALGLAAMAYGVSRRYASHRAFAFGTGKVQALAGYTSATALGLVAVAMIVESVTRLLHPSAIDFAASLPVAVVGLLVNLASVRLLHDDHDHDDHHHDDHHDHHHDDHDHNHRAAFTHVVADALTSVLAIAALLSGRYFGVAWLDPITGIVGGAVISKWAFDLSRSAAFELLDVDPSSALDQEIRAALEAMDDVRVCDLHVWSLGRGIRSCVVTIVASAPRDVGDYRARLERFDLAHLTIEVRRGGDAREGRQPA